MMPIEFTDETRAALGYARDEALRLSHDYVGTEHLLLGVVRGADSRALALLRVMNVTAERVRERVESSVRRGRSVKKVSQLPYTSRGKKVLEFALHAAQEYGARAVTTELVLIGLLREQKGIAAQILHALGVTEEGVRDAMSGGGAVTGFRIELDDRSDRSIYEQIVAQVQEAVATGRLTPGVRLPAVRQLADELDIAPGTVARAYSELERLGTVVTEGARGTRVAEPAAPAGRRADHETMVGLLRPAAVAAYHMGARAQDMRLALESAMNGILD